jgi:hypothetical protein
MTSGHMLVIVVPLLVRLQSKQLIFLVTNFFLSCIFHYYGNPLLLQFDVCAAMEIDPIAVQQISNLFASSPDLC